ncbi:hypothetical protein DFH06DRAFT_1319452 [Mycena polygramma]|nr:hypothetical protein DFH06DRAFT_1319452 [Mycena polygramma]
MPIRTGAVLVLLFWSLLLSACDRAAPPRRLHSPLLCAILTLCHRRPHPSPLSTPAASSRPRHATSGASVRASNRSPRLRSCRHTLHIHVLLALLPLAPPTPSHRCSAPTLSTRGRSSRIDGADGAAGRARVEHPGAHFHATQLPHRHPHPQLSQCVDLNTQTLPVAGGAGGSSEPHIDAHFY